MNVILIAFRPDGSRREARVKGNRMIVGRLQDADLQIPVSAVSRKHCEITLSADGVSVRDLGSSNGTFLNGARVVESPLKPGDTLTVGPATFVIQIDGNPMSVTPDMAVPKAKAASGAPVARSPSGQPSKPFPEPTASSDASSMMAGLPVFNDDSGDITTAVKGAGTPKPAKVAAAKADKPAAPSQGKDGGDADPLSKMISKSKTDDDSSVFEFDFFDEDDDEKR